MKKNLWGVVAIAAAAMTMGCNVFIEVSKTTVRGQNNLTDLVVTVEGADFDIETVDLTDVYIGDVHFSTILAGTVTAEKETEDLLTDAGGFLDPGSLFSGLFERGKLFPKIGEEFPVGVLADQFSG